MKVYRSGQIVQGVKKVAETPTSLSTHGTYVLFARLELRSTLQVGKLGWFDFPEGWYSYVGSAFGPGGLAARLRHHLQGSEHPHWHIDYLLRLARCEFVWAAAGTGRKAEHSWAARIGGFPQARVPAAGFGASDCTCRTHLFHFESTPESVSLKVLSGEHALSGLMRIERDSLHPDLWNEPDAGCRILR